MAGNFLESLVDQLGRIRYGVPTSEKERLARTGELPGSPAADTADSPEADRYASGYLFGQTWPRVSAAAEPAIAGFKALGLPGFGSSSDLQSYAISGGNRGRLDIANQQAGQPSQASFLTRIAGLLR